MNNEFINTHWNMAHPYVINKSQEDIRHRHKLCKLRCEAKAKPRNLERKKKRSKSKFFKNTLAKFSANYQATKL